MRFYKELIFLLPVLLSLAGCAVLKKENRRILNFFDEKVQPESTVAKIAIAPVAAPVGLTCLALDMAVVHPSYVIDDAAWDIYDLYWKTKIQGLLRKGIYYPIFTLLTPPTYVLDWLGRSLFMIPQRKNS